MKNYNCNATTRVIIVTPQPGITRKKMKYAIFLSTMVTTFSDIPKDVIWLIFRFVTVADIVNSTCIPFYHTNRGFQYEKGYTLNGIVMENAFVAAFTIPMCNLALISKSCLKLVRSKCFKFQQGWFFINGAIT